MPWPWFIRHRRCIWPHADATNVRLGLMLQPFPRLIQFFGGPSLPHLFSSSLACQVFSWIPQLPSAALVSECVLHPFLWPVQAIAPFFLRSPSQEIFVLFFSVFFIVNFVPPNAMQWGFIEKGRLVLFRADNTILEFLLFSLFHVYTCFMYSFISFSIFYSLRKRFDK